MVDVWLPYGGTEICVRIPTRNYLCEITPKEVKALSNVGEEVEKALGSPIDAEPLRERAKGGKKASIVLDGSLDKEVYREALNPVLRELTDAGIGKNDTTFIIGCGAESPRREKFAGILEGEMPDNFIVHDSRGEDNVYIGTTRRGTEIYVNRHFWEADVKILMGKVDLHPFAGFSGGRKLILPGISGFRSIRHNHSLIIDDEARPAITEGNPIHEDMLEAAVLAKVDFSINLCFNYKGEPIEVACGDVSESFLRITEAVKDASTTSIKQEADVVVVSAGGHPRDSTLAGSIPALVYAQNAVKKGGIMIFAAECKGGYGDQTFHDWMKRFKRLREMEKAIKMGFEYGGHYAYHLSKVRERARILLVSTLPQIYSEDIFKLRTLRAVNKALEEALMTSGNRSKVAVIPYGGSTLPLKRT